MGRHVSVPLPPAPEKPERLEQAIIKGAGTRDFFGTASDQMHGIFEGFKLGDANVQLDDTLLLIDPVAANTYEVAHPPAIPIPPGLLQPGLTLLAPDLPGLRPADMGSKSIP